jgi:hypothetical protein
MQGHIEERQGEWSRTAAFDINLAWVVVGLYVRPSPRQF